MNIAHMLGENLQKFGVYDQLIYVGPGENRRLTNRCAPGTHHDHNTDGKL